MVFKRGTKYPERNKKFNICYVCRNCFRKVLAAYIVLKAEHMWDSWCNGGTYCARYNRLKSGWFDSTCFHNWFSTVILPYCCTINGPKVLIGDNLSSHLNPDFIAICEDHNIQFVFLPPT